MKVNKLWIVILVILIVGCLTTSYTKRYREQLIGGSAAATEQETAPVQAAPGASVQSASGAETADAGQAVTEQAASDEAASDSQVFETAADFSMARAALPVPEAADGERTNGYLNRLNELDARLEKEQGTSADTTNSMKAAAEQERKLWETELNRILDALEELLPEEEKQALFKAQKEWMRERESIAVESSKKKSGSTLEEVEYNVSLADTTRSRAYELAEQYASVLTGAE